jgi:2-iminobutanoate/2-iminopropanoate deaminase
MKNLAAVLRGAGLSMADVVKTTVFLVDMADFQAMNQVYGAAFPEGPPARTTVAVSGLPKNARVEIEAVAVGRDL